MRIFATESGINRTMWNWNKNNDLVNQIKLLPDSPFLRDLIVPPEKHLRRCRQWTYAVGEHELLPYLVYINPLPLHLLSLLLRRNAGILLF